jgi:hypothetical protein
MAMEYKMIDEVTLKNFKRFLRGIPLREFGPQGAFDAAISKGRAREDEPDDKPARRDYIDAMDELAGKVSPEAFDTICDAIRTKWAKDRKARDGEFSSPMDRNDAESFPNAKRATSAMDAMAFDKLSTPRSTKADKSFAAMYGDAALSIKTNSDPYPIASRTRT